MELTRKQVINTLETLKLEWGALAPPEDNICDALDYAISSLKTDEAYQLMYEGEETYTKADMVAMLTDIQLEIEGQKFDTHIDKNVWNDAIRVCSGLIQQRINSLKESRE